MNKFSTTERIKRLVKEFFKDEPKKVDKWFRTKNPSLGLIAPMDMIMLGNEKKLLAVVEFMISEGKR